MLSHCQHTCSLIMLLCMVYYLPNKTQIRPFLLINQMIYSFLFHTVFGDYSQSLNRSHDHMARSILEQRGAVCETQVADLSERAQMVQVTTVDGDPVSLVTQ